MGRSSWSNEVANLSMDSAIGRAVAGLAIKREFDWLPSRQAGKGPVVKKVSSDAHKHGALIHTRGVELPASETCDKCRSSASPWQSCVVAFDENGDAVAAGACGNCYYNNKASKCSARE